MRALESVFDDTAVLSIELLIALRGAGLSIGTAPRTISEDHARL